MSKLKDILIVIFIIAICFGISLLFFSCSSSNTNATSEIEEYHSLDSLIKKHEMEELQRKAEEHEKLIKERDKENPDIKWI